MSQPIYKVQRVVATFYSPLQLTIEAYGQTNNGPVKSAQLIQRERTSNDLYEYDFVAETGDLTQITDVNVTDVFDKMPFLGTKVKVYGANNSVTVNISELIYRVTDVQASFEGNQLSVKAEGLTTTSGWENPRLIFQGEEEENDQHVFIYDFYAAAPIEGGVFRLTEISANKEQPLKPPFPKGMSVRVNSESSSFIDHLPLLEG